jgi:hypothetical protein
VELAGDAHGHGLAEGVEQVDRRGGQRPDRCCASRRSRRGLRPRCTRRWPRWGRTRCTGALRAAPRGGGG